MGRGEDARPAAEHVEAPASIGEDGANDDERLEPHMLARSGDPAGQDFERVHAGKRVARPFQSPVRKVRCAHIVS